MSTITIVALGIYVAALFIVTIWAARREGLSDYIIASRKTGIWQTSISQFVSTTDGTGMIITLSWAILFGYGLLWLYVGMTIGTMLFTFLVPRIHQQAHAESYVTISDMFRTALGWKSALLVSLVVLFIQFFSTSGQLYAAGNLFSSSIHVSPVIGIFGVAAVITLYMVIGGYAAVIKTDVLQGIAIYITLIFAFLYGHYTPIETVAQQMISFDRMMLAGLLLWGVVYGFGNLFLWQRTFSSVSARVAQQSALINIPMNWILGVGLVVFAQMMVSVYPGIKTDNLVLAGITDPDVLPIVGPLLAVAFMALLMSSVDSYMALFVSTAVGNIGGVRAEADPRRFVYLSRIVLVMSFLLLASMAAFITDFVQYMVNTASLMFVLMGMLFVPLFLRDHRQNDARFVLIFSASLGLWLYMFAQGQFTSLLMNMVPTGIAILLSVSFVVWDRIKNLEGS